MVICKNCGFEFNGVYCPNCSQKASTERLSLKHLLYEIFHSLTHTDTGVFHLIGSLIIRPGVVAREYIEGKRKKYFNPFTFVIIMTAAQAFILMKIDLYPSINEKLSETVQPFLTDSRARQKYLDKMKSTERLTETTIKNGKLITLLLIPVLSGLSFLFFRRSGRNYAENLALNFFVVGGQNVFLLSIIVPLFLLAKSAVLMIMFGYMCFQFCYNVLAYKQFFQGTLASILVKVSLIQIIYLLVVQQASTLLL